MKRKKLILVLLALALLLSFSPASAGYRSLAQGSSYGWGTWKELTTSWETLYSYTFSLPAALYVYVDCDGYANIDNSELAIAIGIDTPVEDVSTRRFYGDSVSRNLTGIHTSRLYKLGAGSHTIYFLGKSQNEGIDPWTNTNYFSISVLVFETGSVSASIATDGDPDFDEDGSR